MRREPWAARLHRALGRRCSFAPWGRRPRCGGARSRVCSGRARTPALEAARRGLERLCRLPVAEAQTLISYAVVIRLEHPFASLFWMDFSSLMKSLHTCVHLIHDFSLVAASRPRLPIVTSGPPARRRPLAFPLLASHVFLPLSRRAVFHVCDLSAGEWGFCCPPEGAGRGPDVPHVDPVPSGV